MRVRSRYGRGLGRGGGGGRNHAAKGGAAALSPPGSPLHWYDFSDTDQLFKTDDTSTPVTADGDDIGYCANKGSSSEPVVQSDITKRPHYDTDAMLTGSALSTAHVLYDDVMADVPTGDFTVACVFEGNGTAGTDYVYLFGATSESRCFCASDQTVNNAISGNTQSTANPYVDQVAVGIWSKSTTSSVQTCHCNLDAADNTGANANNPPDVGDRLVLMGQSTIGGFPWKGSMGEWLCWDSALSTDDLALLETYFTEKWGVSWA